jgi:hypothetical protein
VKPGIYCIQFEENLNEWSVKPRDPLLSVTPLCPELGKIEVFNYTDQHPYSSGKRYTVFLDSIGPIPAFVRGANMITKKIGQVF